MSVDEALKYVISMGVVSPDTAPARRPKLTGLARPGSRPARIGGPPARCRASAEPPHMTIHRSRLE